MLFALGYRTEAVHAILLEEFAAREYEEITYTRVCKYRHEKSDEIMKKQRMVKRMIKRTVEASYQKNFETVRDTEAAMVSIYSRRIDAALKKLDTLDPIEDEEKIENILLIIKKLHEAISKISGSQAIRDLQVFGKKKQIEFTFDPERDPSVNVPKVPLLADGSEPEEDKSDTTKFLT